MHWYFLQDMHILVLLETKHWNQSPKWHQRTISKIVCFIMAPPMGKSWCAVPPLEHHVSQKYFAFIVFAWMVTLWAPRQINMLELCILMHPSVSCMSTDPWSSFGHHYIVTDRASVASKCVGLAQKAQRQWGFKYKGLIGFKIPRRTAKPLKWTEDKKQQSPWRSPAQPLNGVEDTMQQY